MSRHLVIHAGFHKSGTTALQTTLRAKKRELLRHGILYPPSETSGHHRAVWSLTGQRWGWANRGGSTTPPKVWRQLAASIRKHSGTAILSSEFLAGSPEPILRRLASDIPAQKNTVFFTLRPLANILPSSYQQSLKSGQKVDYTTWLRQVLDPSRKSGAARSFWRRHDHPRVLSRWIGVFGRENIVLAITDEAAPEKLYDAFAQILGLSRNVLLSSPSRQVNRSLTWPEIELLLEINRRFPADLRWQDYATFIRGGGIAGLTSQPPPSPQDQPLLTPEWAVEQTQAIAGEQYEQISSLGITLLGDLPATLRADIPVGENVPSGTVSVASAAAALLAIREEHVLSRASVLDLTRELARRAKPSVFSCS